MFVDTEWLWRAVALCHVCVGVVDSSEVVNVSWQNNRKIHAKNRRYSPGNRCEVREQRCAKLGYARS